jgi:hypothetical protein
MCYASRRAVEDEAVTWHADAYSAAEMTASAFGSRLFTARVDAAHVDGPRLIGAGCEQMMMSRGGHS